MWKLILLFSILWFIWRIWTKAWREAIARLAFNARTMPRSHYDSTGFQETQQTSSDQTQTHASAHRVVKCERCGIYIPMNEVRQIPESLEGEPRYVCYPSCSSESTKV
jgi:hypothetical protein